MKVTNKENQKPCLLKLCPDCFQPISQGCRHACGPQAEFNNISIMLGPDKIEKLCHSFIKEKAMYSGDILSLSGRFGCNPMKVAINKKDKQKKKVFNLKETVALRTEGNFTSKYVLF